MASCKRRRFRLTLAVRSLGKVIQKQLLVNSSGCALHCEAEVEEAADCWRGGTALTGSYLLVKRWQLLVTESDFLFAPVLSGTKMALEKPIPKARTGSIRMCSLNPL